ncbi:MAG: hypothetical protein IJZ85_08080 [Lachnospiraceae bacterium]|nr:hypothetical protein [Lachnospiraceae bacterium]
MKEKIDLKALSKKERVEYIWDYYRYHIVLTILAVVCVAAFVVRQVNYRPPQMEIIMVNAGVMRSEIGDSFDEFLELYGYENYEDAVYVDTSLYIKGDVADSEVYQVLSVILASGSRDMLFAPEEVFLAYAYQGAAADISKLLSEELLEKFADQLVYVEKLDGSGTYPCGIRLVDHPWMSAQGYYPTGECFVGVLNLAKNPEIAADFLRYLLNVE